jgi:Na+/H+ antiporter NhaD/arsenite permease-like protein
VPVAVVAFCAAPVLAHAWMAAGSRAIVASFAPYGAFVVVLAALFVTSGGIVVEGTLGSTPRANTALLAVGSVLASVIGTMGASILLIRPFLEANRGRVSRVHLVPFFVILVGNVGGLLTPLGDPPLLLGYVSGVPFFWCLRLLPAWCVYVGSLLVTFYVVDRRAGGSRREGELEDHTRAVEPLRIRGIHNVALLLAIGPATLLSPRTREIALVGIAVLSMVSTPPALRRKNGFSLAPIIEVAYLFAGIFACLGPVQEAVATAAPTLPIRTAWQLFWASGIFSSVLDNAPTYATFAALARGLPAHGDLVAGADPVRLAAVSIGSVVMGATTYVGNAPNWIVRAIGMREKFPVLDFFRYAALTFALMLPAHAATTIVLAMLDRG